MITFQLTIAVGLLSLGGLASSTALPDQPLTTKNISFFFKENSTELVSDSAWCMQCCGVAELGDQLDTLANVLKENPTIVLEIGGHADAREHLPDSIALARAQFVVNALVQRSIAPARLQAVSYGCMQPLIRDVQLAQMQTEVEKADARGHNRRVWPKVISFDYKP